MVPHGTFTMTKTAQVLEKALEQKMEEKSAKNLSPKAVVLVGSLVPFGEPSSDAFDNLAVALRWLQSHEAILIFDTKTSYIVIAGRSATCHERQTLEGGGGRQGPGNRTICCKTLK